MKTREKFATLAALLCFSSFTWAGMDHAMMGQQSGADDPIPADQAGTAVAQSMTEGEVRRIDSTQGKITLKHGPLVNLGMSMGMTMVFRVQDPSVLASLNVGDRVRFRAERLNGALTVTSIERIAD